MWNCIVAPRICGGEYENIFNSKTPRISIEKKVCNLTDSTRNIIKKSNKEILNMKSSVFDSVFFILNFFLFACIQFIHSYIQIKKYVKKCH